MAETAAAATMCEAFQATVARYPQQVALRSLDGAASITWEQYAGRVRQIAAGLARLGIGRGDTVALMMTNRTEFHLVDTAAFHLGAAPFSVYNTLAHGQIQYVLADAGSRVVVCEQQFAPRLLEVTAGTAIEHVVCVDGTPDGTSTLAELEAGGDPGFGFEACWRAAAPGDLLTLVYTSGTTGPPKGVEIIHGQVLAGLLAIYPIMPSGPGDRVVSYLPMAHIAERYFSHYSGVFTGLQAAPVADIKALPGALRDIRPTIFGGVPRVWEKLKAAAEALAACEPGQGRQQAVADAFEAGQRYVRAILAGQVPAGMAEAYRRADEQVLSTIRVALGLDQVRFARRPYITALIVLDPDTTAAFAAQHAIPDPAPAALAAHPAIRAAVAAAVQEANSRLSRVEQIKRYAIVPAFWEPGGEEITPTMKLRRHAISAKYADAIDSLYAGAGQPVPAASHLWGALGEQSRAGDGS